MYFCVYDGDFEFFEYEFVFYEVVDLVFFFGGICNMVVIVDVLIEM